MSLLMLSGALALASPAVVAQAAPAVAAQSASPSTSNAVRRTGIEAASEGIESRYVRGVITKERDDEFATVSVTPGEGKWGRYAFTVAVFNKSGAPINVGSENVSARMLDGTVVAALPATEVVRIAGSRARWAAFGTALAAGLANSNYSTYSGSTFSHASGRVGYSGFNYHGYSHTSGRYYDATAAALNQQRTDYQLSKIRAGLDDLIANVGENYFSTNTLNDGDGFGGTVLIDKMKFKKAKGDKTLRREFVVTVEVAGRSYPFPFTAPK